MSIMLYLIAIFLIMIVLASKISEKPGRAIYLVAINYAISIFQYNFSEYLSIPIITKGINLGFVSLINYDIVVIILLIVMFSSLCSDHFCVVIEHKIRSLVMMLFIFGCISVISCIQGLIQNSFDTNWLSDFRRFTQLIVGIAYVYTYKNQIELEQYKHFLEKFFYGVMVYAYAIWFLYLVLGIQLSIMDYAFRIIQPANIYVFSLFAGYLVYKDLFQNKASYLRLPTVFACLCVFLDQYRTVWVSFATEIVILLLIYFFVNNVSMSTKVSIILQLGVVIGVSTSVILRGSFLNGDMNALLNSFDSLEDTSMGTRTEVWSGLLLSLSGLQSLFGQSFGSGYDAGIGWTHSPHSGWIELIMRTGFVGAGLFLGILLVSIKILKRDEHYPLVIALIAGFIVYMISYTFSFEIGVSVGLFALLLGKSTSEYDDMICS